MLGERVVLSLSKTVRNEQTVIACDRFFTCPSLFARSKLPLVGTYNKNRKHTPKELNQKVLKKKNDFDFSGSSIHGLLATKWMDNKHVLLLSNCHTSSIGEVTRKQRDGQKETVFSPQAIIDYNRYMAGTDRCDQMASLYNYGRKSTKWWKKVFFRLFKIALVNSWVIFFRLNSHQKKSPPIFYMFLFRLASQLIERACTANDFREYRQRRVGRPSTKDLISLDPVGKHMIVRCKGRRRCTHCSSQKIESRVSFICNSCNVPLCPACFNDYHKNMKRKYSEDVSSSDEEAEQVPRRKPRTNSSSSAAPKAPLPGPSVPAPGPSVPAPAPPPLIDLAAAGGSKTTRTTRSVSLKKKKIVRIGNTFTTGVEFLKEKHNLTTDVAMSVLESVRLMSQETVLPLENWGNPENDN